ncbi:hypothetical protein [Bacillus infantis]|uniref:hypothetical protein n=1 Tax=Bacillus infantis TaxID=324767 RepID=UPI0016537EC0|nr:hypothetical protein [Bacillus infantis]
MKKFLFELLLTMIVLFLLLLIISFFMIVHDKSFEEAAVGLILVWISLNYAGKV